MNTLKIASLFTSDGLCQALKAHHKNLSKHHDFPPLSGVKSLHRFAELFDLDNAEQFENRLAKSAPITTDAFNATVNLVNKTAQAQITCLFDGQANTLSVQQVGKPPLLSVSLPESPIMAPHTHYQSNEEALVTYGNLQVFVFLVDNHLIAEMYHRNHPSRVLCRTAIDDETVPLMERQTFEYAQPLTP